MVVLQGLPVCQLCLNRSLAFRASHIQYIVTSYDQTPARPSPSVVELERAWQRFPWSRVAVGELGVAHNLAVCSFIHFRYLIKRSIVTLLISHFSYSTQQPQYTTLWPLKMKYVYIGIQVTAMRQCPCYLLSVSSLCP